MSLPAVSSAQCQVCRSPLGPEAERRKQYVCSARCRGIAYRRRQAEALRARDRELRALLEAALRTLEERSP